MNSHITVLLICFLTFSLSLPARADSSKEKSGYSTVKKVVSLFSVWSDDKQDQSIVSEIDKYIDYGEMTKRALGESWYQLSTLEKKEYVFVFRKLVEDKYYKRWRKILSKGTLSKVSEVDTKDSLYVKARFKNDDDYDDLIFRLSKKTPKLKIISISVGDKDLLTRITIRIRKHVKKHGIEKLLAWMKDKADIKESNRLKSTAKK